MRTTNTDKIKQALVASHKKMIKNLCETVHKIYIHNNNVVPYGLLSSIVEEHKESYPKLNKSMLKQSFNRYKKRKVIGETIPLTNTVVNIASQNDAIPHTVFVNDEASDLTASTLSNVSELASDRKKGGRPKGTTLMNQEQLNRCIIAAKNEITEEYRKKVK